MAQFNVFLDTNIFIKTKYNFKAGPLYNLKKYCDQGTVALFTNPIILHEVQNHIDADVNLLASQAKNAIKNHAELVNAISKPVYESIETTLLGAAAGLSAEFTDFMHQATVLPIDGLPMVTLFNDYFGNTAPFEKREAKKSEFPDAVAIMSIKHYLDAEKGAVMHVITDDNGWHNALMGVEGVVLYKDIKTLLTEISQEEEMFQKIAQYMGDCLEYIQPSVESWLDDQDWGESIENLEMCVECDEINDMYISAVRLTPNSVEYIDKENSCAVAGFAGVAKIRIEFSYIDHTNEIYDREDHVWYNTIYGNGTAEIEVPFTGTVTVLISDDETMEFDSPDFDQIDLSAIEVLENELTPHREDDDPYFDTCPGCGKPIGIHNDGGNGFCIECAARH